MPVAQNNKPGLSSGTLNQPLTVCPEMSGFNRHIKNIPPPTSSPFRPVVPAVAHPYHRYMTPSCMTPMAECSLASTLSADRRGTSGTASRALWDKTGQNGTGFEKILFRDIR